MKVIVLGASPNPSRYSYKAVRMLLRYGHDPVPVGVREGEIEGKAIIKGKPQVEGVHTVTLYLNPQRQQDYYEWILSLSPRRVIFNPGTENTEFKQLLEQRGIETVENCTLVMLASGLF